MHTYKQALRRGLLMLFYISRQLVLFCRVAHLKVVVHDVKLAGLTYRLTFSFCRYRGRSRHSEENTTIQKLFDYDLE